MADTVDLPEIVVHAQNAAPLQLSQSPNVPDDVATLVVNGMQFNDWESVSVTAYHTEAASEFRFVAAERSFRQPVIANPGNYPIPPEALLQFGPGDKCAIYLGRNLVIDGYVELRQVGYDSDRHAVEITGVNRTAPVMRSSVDTKTGSFDGMSFQQVVTKVLSAYPEVGFKTVGLLNPIPFIKLQNQPGEPIWDFFERIARPRGIVIGNDSYANFLAVQDHVGKVVASLIEGKNIKKCSAIYHKRHNFEEVAAIGQTAGSDQSSGPAVSEQEATYRSDGYIHSKLIVPSEQPVTLGELQDRAKWEALWLAGNTLKIFITTTGWYSDIGKLWWPLDDVYIYSPMVPIDSPMAIQTVTFRQSRDGGTESEIELVMPWALRDYIGLGKIAVQPPGPVPPGQGILPTP